MTKVHPDLFVVTDVLFSSNSSIFHFFHVLEAETSGFKPHGGHQFLNPLNSLNYFSVLEMYLKVVSTRFLLVCFSSLKVKFRKTRKNVF